MTSTGSSPRMRGTRIIGCIWVAVDGIIPAYAGNTYIEDKASSAKWDHPRVCGEHQISASALIRRKGSSPRMRGTPGRIVKCEGCGGIIPAYAGNTGRRPALCAGVGDHPRVCGEHAKLFCCDQPAAGSSPRMRGTRGSGCGNHQFIGIIPAYAGNTES